MKKKVYFISGAYGVGKTTICTKISKIINVPYFSASDLISKTIGEKYGSNKEVKNKNLNQWVLIDAVNNILEIDNSILLSGHFSIFNKHEQIEKLPKFVYEKLNIEKIILLETSVHIIHKHLVTRDKKDYKLSSIQRLLESEKSLAQLISNNLHKPLCIHTMTFSDFDVEQIISFLQK